LSVKVNDFGAFFNSVNSLNCVKLVPAIRFKFFVFNLFLYVTKRASPEGSGVAFLQQQKISCKLQKLSTTIWAKVLAKNRQYVIKQQKGTTFVQAV